MFRNVYQSNIIQIMKISEKFKNTDKTYFSFEILPPLKGKNIDDIYKEIDPLIEFNPMNINVTYHQHETVFIEDGNGVFRKRTVRKRPGTVALAAAINYRYPQTIVVPHLICGGLSQNEIEDILVDLNFLNIHNILALRGDAQKGQRYFIPEPEGHEHTVDMVHQISNINRGKYLEDGMKNSTGMNFCIGVAGYPEKHIEAPNMKTDLAFLKQKVDAGAEYIVTQMFFDNQKYFDFVDACREIGITVPIIPGVKPIRNMSDFKLLPQVFNIDFPDTLTTELQNAKDDKAAMQIGIEWTVQQSKELIARKVPAVHYYTIGKSDNICQIAKLVF